MMTVMSVEPMAMMKQNETQKRKHEALPFRKVILLAIELMGQETGRYRRKSTRPENMKALSDATGITRTVIPRIRKGETVEPTRSTYQKMAQWLKSLEEPLTDEHGIPIQYEWYELEILDQLAKDKGLDKSDPYIVAYDRKQDALPNPGKVQNTETPEPKQNQQQEDRLKSLESKIDQLAEIVFQLAEKG